VNRINNPHFYKTRKNGKIVYLTKDPLKPKVEDGNRKKVDPTNYTIRINKKNYGVEGFIKNHPDQIKYLVLQHPKSHRSCIIHNLRTNTFKENKIETIKPYPYIVKEIELFNIIICEQILS